MKLLLVSPFTSTSGSAVRFRHLARHLASSGFEVVYVERRARSEAIPVLHNVNYHSSPKLTNLYLDILLSMMHNIFVLLCNLDCRLFYVLKPAPNNGFPGLLARILGKRIFLDIDDLDYGYLPKGFNRTVFKFIFHFLPQFFDLITCHTRNLHSFITGKLGIDADHVYLLQQGVSDAFAIFDAGRRESIPKSLVYVATLGITSDFDYVLPMLTEICKRHNDLQINVVGDGIRRNKFEGQVRTLDLGGNFRFHGQVSHNEVPRLVSANWIGINYMRRSTTNECRAILKIREYLSVGLQVVCNDVGDAREFSEFVYIEKDLSGMESRLLRLLQTGLVDNVRGRAFIRKYYNWDSIVQSFIVHSGIASEIRS